MAPIRNNPTRYDVRNLPPLLQLPNELLVKIANCCRIREFTALSATDRFFRASAKHANLAQILYQTEYVPPFTPNLLPSRKFICHDCQRVLPERQFESTQLRFAAGQWINFDQWRWNAYRRGGARATERKCLQCGIKSGMY